MSSDGFIISSACDVNASMAIRQAVELAGVSPARIQDAVFGLDPSLALPDLDSISELAGLACPSVGVTSHLRALSFSAASLLCDDADLSVVVSLEKDACAAIVLASAEAVGRLNLFPRARLAARSLSGLEPALRLAELTASDVQLRQEGDSLILLHDLLGQLESQSARWGLLSSADLALLVERT